MITAGSDGQIELQAAESTEDGKPSVRNFSMTAYTGGLMQVSGFPRPVVVDLSGMKVSAKAKPILRDHESSQIVGHTTEIKLSDSEIRIQGALSGANNHSEEVSASADNGFPWQSSIGATIQKMTAVDDGEKVRVNGRVFKGPLLIARKSTLREVSFVGLGADENTSARVAASDKSLKLGAQTMLFEKWLSAKGFDADTLSESQLSSLQAMYEAEQENQAGDGDSGGDSGAGSVSAGADTDGKTTLSAAASIRIKAAAEIERVDEIGQICAKYDNPTMEVDGKKKSIEALAVGEGWDIKTTELEAMRESRPKGFSAHTHTSKSATAGVIEASMCIEAGMTEEEVGESFDDQTMEAALSVNHRGAGIHELIHLSVQANGGHIRPGKIGNDEIRAAFEADQTAIRASGGFSTISLSGILGNVANKSMLAAYSAVNTVWQHIASVTSHSDFKTHTRYRMTGKGEFTKVGPDGELKHIELSEDSYSNTLDTSGALIALTRHMQINDDLGAFVKIPQIIGRMSAIELETLFFTLLLSNPSNFFHADNSNYIEGSATALDIDSLTTGEQTFLDQTDSNGKPILLTPKTLLLPTTLKVTGQQLFDETKVEITTTANKAKPSSNPHAGKFTPIATPFLNAQSLTGSSGVAWYMFSDPADIAAMEVAFLRGQQRPTIERGETSFNTLGMQWRGFFDFGIAMQDHRGAMKSKGAA